MIEDGFLRTPFLGISLKAKTLKLCIREHMGVYRDRFPNRVESLPFARHAVAIKWSRQVVSPPENSSIRNLSIVEESGAARR
jgi:hypothetical protein